jgi:hypothetical protein
MVAKPLKPDSSVTLALRLPSTLAVFAADPAFTHDQEDDINPDITTIPTFPFSAFFSRFSTLLPPVLFLLV